MPSPTYPCLSTSRAASSTPASRWTGPASTTGAKSRKKVAMLCRTLSSLHRKRGIDGRDDVRRIRPDLAVERRDQFAFAVQQILVEVPAWRALGRAGPFIKRMCSVTFDHLFGGQ